MSRTRARGPLETVLRRQVIVTARAWGAMVWPQNNVPSTLVRNGQTVTRFGTTPNGMADIGGILPGGRGLQFEVKRPGERVRYDQGLWLEEASKFGAFCAVLYGTDSALEVLSRLTLYSHAVLSPWLLSPEREYWQKVTTLRAVERGGVKGLRSRLRRIG